MDMLLSNDDAPYYTVIVLHMFILNFSLISVNRSKPEVFTGVWYTTVYPVQDLTNKLHYVSQVPKKKSYA